MGGIGEEKEGDISASTGELEAGRRRVTLTEKTSAREKAPPAVVADTEIGTVPLNASQLSSRSLRPLPVVGQSTPSPDVLGAHHGLVLVVALSLARRHRRPLLPCSTPSAPSQPMSLQSSPHLCVTSARACVRLVGGAWRAPQFTPSTTLAAAAPAALVAWPKTIDVPLSGPKHQNSSEKGRARSTRGAGGRQTLPTPWPIGTALARAPDRSRRRPGAVLHCRTVDFCGEHRFLGEPSRAPPLWHAPVTGDISAEIG